MEAHKSFRTCPTLKAIRVFQEILETGGLMIMTEVSSSVSISETITAEVEELTFIMSGYITTAETDLKITVICTKQQQA